MRFMGRTAKVARGYSGRHGGPQYNLQGEEKGRERSIRGLKQRIEHRIKIVKAQGPRTQIGTGGKRDHETE